MKGKFSKILNTIFFQKFPKVYKKNFQKKSHKNIKINSISIFVI